MFARQSDERGAVAIGVAAVAIVADDAADDEMKSVATMTPGRHQAMMLARRGAGNPNMRDSLLSVRKSWEPDVRQRTHDSPEIYGQTYEW